MDLYGFSDDEVSIRTQIDQNIETWRTSNQEAQDTVKENKATAESNVAQLNTLIPGYHAQMIRAKWAAYHAKINYYDHIVTGGVISRLASRGYDMNYEVVVPYLAERTVQTGITYAIRQSQYITSQNTYYGAVAARDFYSSEAVRMGELGTQLKQDSVDFEDWVKDFDAVKNKVTEYSGIEGHAYYQFLEDVVDNTRDLNIDATLNPFFEQNDVDGELLGGFNRFFNTDGLGKDILHAYFAEGIGEGLQVKIDAYYVRAERAQKLQEESLKTIQKYEAEARRSYAVAKFTLGAGVVAVGTICAVGTAGVGAGACTAGAGLAMGSMTNEAINISDAEYTIRTGDYKDSKADFLAHYVDRDTAEKLSMGINVVSDMALEQSVTLVTAGYGAGFSVAGKTAAVTNTTKGVKMMKVGTSPAKSSLNSTQRSIISKSKKVEIPKHNHRNVQDTKAWDDIEHFLGDGKRTNVNPYTKKVEKDRIFSIDNNGNIRSVRMGKHEMKNPNKFHYHLEKWDNDLKDIIRPDDFVHVNPSKRVKK